MKRYRWVLGLLPWCATAFAAAPAPLGRLERVEIEDATPIVVTAQLDGRLERTTLYALDIKYFSRDGQTWVRFTVDNGDVLPGQRVTLSRRVLRDQQIRLRNGGIEHRPLVALDLCLGQRRLPAEVDLRERQGYTPPLVLGPAELARLPGVDPARQYTSDPACAPPTAAAAPKEN
ncbi:MAG: RimK/LysX family protein [Sinobacteraceae bacterium]|nr:RimK/LysX family protein [Nevskiaceae bacterium]